MFAEIEDYEAVHGTDVDAITVRARLEKATADIRSACRQTISRATSTVNIKGTWDRELTLPEWPVVSVATVLVDDVAVTLDDAVVSTRSILWPTTHRASPGAAATAQGWGGPHCLVTVTYTHGFETVPDDVKWLCVELAAAAQAVPAGARSTATSLGSYQEQVTYDSRGEQVALQLAAVVQRYGK